MSTKLSETQLAALFVLDQTPLERQADGQWRPIGKVTPFSFPHEDIQLFKARGFVQMMPIGALITDAGREELRAQHLIK